MSHTRVDGLYAVTFIRCKMCRYEKVIERVRQDELQIRREINRLKIAERKGAPLSRVRAARQARLSEAIRHGKVR